MFATTYMYFAFYISIKDTPMMLVTTITNMSPIITVVMAAIFLRERISGKEIMCLVLAFTGIFILIQGGSSKNEDNTEE